LLHELQPEPDPPIMTPRIVAVTDVVGAGWAHVVLGAARMREGDPARAEWVVEECEHIAPGQALVLHTTPATRWMCGPTLSSVERSTQEPGRDSAQCFGPHSTSASELCSSTGTRALSGWSFTRSHVPD
jgi:hypothetical protein